MDTKLTLENVRDELKALEKVISQASEDSNEDGMISGEAIIRIDEASLSLEKVIQYVQENPDFGEAEPMESTSSTSFCNAELAVRLLEINSLLTILIFAAKEGAGHYARQINHGLFTARNLAADLVIRLTEVIGDDDPPEEGHYFQF